MSKNDSKWVRARVIFEFQSLNEVNEESQKKRSDRSTYYPISIFNIRYGQCNKYYIFYVREQYPHKGCRSSPIRKQQVESKMIKENENLWSYCLLLLVFRSDANFHWNYWHWLEPKCVSALHIKNTYQINVHWIDHWKYWIGMCNRNICFYAVPYEAFISINRLHLEDYDDESMKWPFSQFS